MRILLLGEFSSFYNYLADGLKVLGHDVFLANNGDGARGFYADYNWAKGTSGKLGKLQGIFNIYNHRELFKGFDVVQLISPTYSPSLPWVNRKFVEYLIAHNDRLFWTPAGTSQLIDRFWIEESPVKHPLYEYFKANSKGRKMFYEHPSIIEYEKWFIENMNGIIAPCFDYAEPFRKLDNFCGTIPFPINVDKIQYKPNRVKDKIVFYHGVTRPGKGTSFIREAFDRMRPTYNEIAKFSCVQHLPFDEYMKLVANTNIVLDQTRSYGSGMNGLISLAQGKIVLGGAEPEHIHELGYSSCPIINITSDANQICEAIQYVIDNKEHIEEMGAKSRQFIEEYHHYVKVAKEYVIKWGVD